MRHSKQWVGLVLAIGFITLVSASDQNYDKRFARISYVDGNVVFRHGTDTDWVAGSVNTPLQEQDRLYVPLNSRGEVEFDDGSYFRLAEDSEIRILKLDKNLIQLEISIGLATLRLGSGLDYVIETPGGTIRALEKGSYRIEVMRDGSMDLAIRKGSADLVRASGSQRIRRNEAVTVPAAPTAQIAYRPIGQEDAWDAFNDRRDATEVASYSRRYLPSDVYIGVAPLDYYGSWVNVGGYGHCWRPMHISYGWSPYRDGRWVYRPFWGWTWVSYEPWGWLPYHYGRWFYDPIHSWCWYPNSGFGLSFSFNFWSPGLVHFYRYGGGYHWLPVHPHDYYSGHNYYYNVNNNSYNDHIRNYNASYGPDGRDRQARNMGVAGAMNYMGDKGFTGARSAERSTIPAAEVIARGTPVSSARDLDVRPGTTGRSSRPDVDVRGLGVRDASLERTTAGGGAGGIRPSVRTLVPSSTAQGLVANSGSARDASSDQPSGRRILGGYSSQAPGVRTITPRQDSNAPAGATAPSTNLRDRDNLRDSGNGSARDSRRIAPIVAPETASPGAVRQRLPREGEETTAVPSQTNPQNQRRDYSQTPTLTTTEQDRGSQRRFITRDSSGGSVTTGDVQTTPGTTRVLPNVRRVIPSENSGSFRDSGAVSSTSSGFRDREYSSVPAIEGSRVRVFTPGRSVPQSSSPAMSESSPQREERSIDRGWPSGGSSFGSGMSSRDRGASVGSAPRGSSPASAPSVRAPIGRKRN
jgi:hypothetical protein